MFCFGGVAMRGGSRSRPWRAKCAGIAATVGSRLRRSIKGLRRRRRTTSSVMHHRRQYSTSLAPVYADELYNHHHQQPSSGKLVAANTTNTVGARAGGKPRAAAAGVGAMRNILMRSPGRGGGVLGAVKGMGGGGPESRALHTQVQGGHAAAEPEVGGGVPGHAGKRATTPH